MNLSASKILLGISLATYAYVLRAHIFGMSESLPARAGAATTAAPVKELSASSLQRHLVIKIPRDPFGMAEALAAATQPATRPTTAPATKPTTLPATKPTTLPIVKVPVRLEGILYGPAGRAAVINGQAVKQGETIRIEPRGTSITATEIGADSVIVQSGGQSLRLKLPKPPTDDDVDTAIARAQAQERAQDSTTTSPARARKQGTVASVPSEP